LRRKAAKPPALKRRAAPKPSADELKLFRSSVSGVTPLPARNKAPLDKPRPHPVRRRPADRQAPVDDLSDHVTPAREAGEALSFSRPGVQRQAVRRLRRGGPAIEDELDLHGLTVAEARPLLISFLNACARRGLRRVRIIHGKGLRSASGEGVLKSMVASWLTQRDDVLAFHEARQADGGSGAVVVLLRGMRDEG
jgi:DNA-nicking Smr family endonuclease